MRGHYSDVWQAIARAFPDRPAIVTPDDTMTYRRFAADAGALAGHLARAGVGPGDAVAVMLYNRPEYLVTLFACFARAIAPVTLNYRYRATEVRALLEDSGARVLVYPTSLWPVVREAVADWAHAPALITVDDDPPALPSADADAGVPWSEAIAVPGILPVTPPAGAELRLYTGGTTGRPKAVVWGAEDILSVQLYSIYGTVGLPLPQTMDDVVAVAADPATPAPRTLPLAPFMHGTALFTSMNTLVLGGTILVIPSPRLDADAAFRFAVDAGATRLVVAGDAIALPLIEAWERSGERSFGAVGSLISSGMRFSPQAKRRFHARADLVIIDLLASTEGGPYAVNTTASVADVPGRLRLLPGAVVLDDDLREVQHLEGGRGVLAFRGTLPRGYFRDEEKTREAFPVINGVRHVMPGDWAVSHGDGTVDLLGRGSAVVNTGGEKVYPVEVEEALLAFPAIADAVVFGMPDARYGEAVTAVVVVQGTVALDADALRAHLDTLLAGYKKPRNVIVRDSLERSPHGKVDLPRMKASLRTVVGAVDTPTGTLRIVR
ncbi:AMP-binding protein [Microbacterium sp. cx-55]|uniref:AMP-binding protein n=1 Tax=Microbacterium sp. cx-55 TaxID=2875948 RepID=UPI001CBEF2A7|nr:AMP-binding protein [Microbacterium sp. cx-55]MBZ4488384.1 AMP-binding protein [Microbacterium sp. cx-55]UGB35036.1 AMP-binding protein [Microbacterium sp. cx-55]